MYVISHMWLLTELIYLPFLNSRQIFCYYKEVHVIDCKQEVAFAGLRKHIQNTSQHGNTGYRLMIFATPTCCVFVARTHDKVSCSEIPLFSFLEWPYFHYFIGLIRTRGLFHVCRSWCGTQNWITKAYITSPNIFARHTRGNVLRCLSESVVLEWCSWVINPLCHYFLLMFFKLKVWGPNTMFDTIWHNRCSYQLRQSVVSVQRVSCDSRTSPIPPVSIKPYVNRRHGVSGIVWVL